MSIRRTPIQATPKSVGGLPLNAVLSASRVVPNRTPIGCGGYGDCETVV